MSSCREKLTQDLCDALLVAYTGYLNGQERTESLGIYKEATIVVPTMEYVGLAAVWMVIKNCCKGPPPAAGV